LSGSSFWFTVNGSPLSEKTKEMRFCVIPLRDHRLFVLSVILTNLLVRISVFTAINGKRLFLSARSRTGALRDDSLVRHPDNVSGQDLGLWVLRSMYAKNGTDHSRSRNAPKIIGGRKAGEDRAGTQCTENHQWTQGWRRSCQDAWPASRG